MLSNCWGTFYVLICPDGVQARKSNNFEKIIIIYMICASCPAVEIWLNQLFPLIIPNNFFDFNYNKFRIISSIFAIQTTGLNYGHVQLSWTKLLGCNFLISATSPLWFASAQLIWTYFSKFKSYIQRPDSIWYSASRFYLVTAPAICQCLWRWNLSSLTVLVWSACLEVDPV